MMKAAAAAEHFLKPFILPCQRKHQEEQFQTFNLKILMFDSFVFVYSLLSALILIAAEGGRS